MAAHWPQHQYEFVYFPTLEQLRRAVCFWHDAARQFNLDYALVGSIVARLRTYTYEELQINSIEILVRPTALANNAQILRDIKDRRPDILRLTNTNELVVIIEGNKLIRLHFSATATKHYPCEFIPPIAWQNPIAETPLLAANIRSRVRSSRSILLSMGPIYPLSRSFAATSVAL